MYIEIEKYGDNGTYTDCVFKCPDSTNFNALLQEFYVKLGIEKDGFHLATGYKKPVIVENGINGLTDCEQYPDLFIEFLLKKGFNKIKTKAVRFSD